jgi:hypothetical protein
VAQEQSAAVPDWMVGLVLVGAVVGLCRVWRTEPLVAMYTLVLVVVPVVVMIGLRPSDLYARFFSYLPPFLLTALVAGGVECATLVRRWLPPRLAVFAWAPAAFGAALLFRNWAIAFPSFQVDEGFRAGVLALESGASDTASFCAIGAGAELFQWYASKPLALPKTINELLTMERTVGRRAPEVRGIARPSSWESRANTDLRHYVEERATTESYGDIVVYRLRSRQ